jgi:hypothetical protein
VFPLSPVHFKDHSLWGAFLLKPFIPRCWTPSHVPLQRRPLPHSSPGSCRPGPSYSRLAEFCSFLHCLGSSFSLFLPLSKTRKQKLWKIISKSRNKQRAFFFFLYSFALWRRT